MAQAVEIASNEDGVVWFARDCSRREARREYARMTGERDRPWRIEVRSTFLRPANQSDCGARSHGRDAEGDRLDDDCQCGWYEEEGWQFECDGRHLEARAAWRVDYRLSPKSWAAFRRFTSGLHPRGRGHGFRPVLWGGRVERRAYRVDRLLIPHKPFRLPGDRWFRLGEGELRWCDVCRAVTPQHGHRHGRRLDRWHCDADDHFKRLGEIA
jgi:hypothetical protein